MKNSDATFTAHVRALVHGDAIPADDLAPMWTKLRCAVLAELRLRGLYQAPPRYLGIYGTARWTPSTLEDLLVDCYSAAFLQRLRSLKGQLEVRRDIDGLIFRNIRNYLHDRQKKHDPLGFRVFNLLRSAVRAAVEVGELHVLAGSSDIGSTTVLGRDAAAATPEAKVDVDSQPALEKLEALTVRWNDDLLPDLVTALGRSQKRVVAQLHQHLRDLTMCHGIEAFRFRALCSSLKKDARSRWKAAWQDEQGQIVVSDLGAREFLMACRRRPGKALEDRDQFEKLVQGVTAGLDRLDLDAVSRDYLRRLWTFYRCHAADIPMPSQDDTDATARVPSQRKLSRLLGIPRDRLPPLHRLLRQQIDHCFRQFHNPVVISDLEGEERSSESTYRSQGA